MSRTRKTTATFLTRAIDYLGIHAYGNGPEHYGRRAAVLDVLRRALPRCETIEELPVEISRARGEQLRDRDRTRVGVGPVSDRTLDTYAAEDEAYEEMRSLAEALLSGEDRRY